jgi:5S rRNA maturation endonuclease (ribonuclease M5)
MIQRREKSYREFRDFLGEFVRDLNHRSGEGWALLVEGTRDVKALRKLGYAGGLSTVAALARKGRVALGDSGKVVILTDLDREGAYLAAKYVKRLTHEGLRTSLGERRRLKAASRGVFLHIENLSRFGTAD